MHSSSSFNVQRATSLNTHSNNNISANMGGSQSAFRVPVELSSNHTVFANPITVDRNCIITDRNHMIPDPQRSPGSKSSPNYFVANLTSSPSSDSLTQQTLGACNICGDRATGKHYGASSCDGCKGFFRRTIRKNHHYVCRFHRNCLIDKDKRNSCRFCRFQSCVRAGMRKEAVQNERDRIRNVKRKNSNNLLQAPNDHLNLIMEAENVANQLRATVITNTNGNSPSVPNTVLPNCITRLASIHDLSEAIKQQLVLLVEWAKALPPFCELDLQDQVALLRAYAAVHLILGVARRSMPYKDVLLLSNDACIPRSHCSEIHDVNNVTVKVLDALVEPMRELDLNDTEYGSLKALLFFNPNVQGLSNKQKVKETRQNFLEALQDYVKRPNNSTGTVDKLRFGNILLLPPPLQALSQQFIEDLQLATLFGMARFDKLLEELLLSNGEHFSGPFLEDGITAVADRMAGGFLNLVNPPNAPSAPYRINDTEKFDHTRINL